MTKRLLVTGLLGLALATTGAVTASAQDARTAVQKAEAAERAARERAARIEQEILSDKARLTAEVERLEKEQADLQTALANLERTLINDGKRLDRLTARWEALDIAAKEVSGNVLVAARDMKELLEASPLTAIAPERLEAIAPVLDKNHFPGIDDIGVMADVYFDEMKRSGQVSFVESPYVGRDGETRTAKVLTLGKFTTVYREGDEVGFLRYAPETQEFYALSTLPPAKMARKLRDYTAGQTDAVPMDISGGTALRTITHEASFLDQVKAGGVLVWPIGIIAVLVVLISIYKFLFLNRVHGNTDRVMGRVNELAARGDWEAVESFMNEFKNKDWPVVNVIKEGLAGRHENRATLESMLQESILRELPRLERGLSTLAVFGAVAPLIGLLGTVTGMIDTFRVITLFGTGDPKLMSGGISEALVTTMLGLMVAIPTMLLHTFLSRRTNSIVGDMEEKAVTLSNIIHKESKHGSVAAAG